VPWKRGKTANVDVPGKKSGLSSESPAAGIREKKQKKNRKGNRLTPHKTKKKKKTPAPPSSLFSPNLVG